MLTFAKNLTLFAAFSVAFAGAFVGNVHGQDDATTAAIEYFNAGQDAHEKGDLKKAVENYQNALKQMPEFPEAEYQLGVAFLALERRPEAESAFRRAIELREDWTLPMVALGSLLLERDALAEADTILTKAVELDAQNSPALAALAELRLRTKSPPPILEDLLGKIKTLTAKAKPTAALWLAQAALERSLGGLDAARKSVGRALQLEPDSRGALAERVEISIAANDSRLAIADAEALVKSAPASVSARFLLARALASNGDLSEALKLIDSISDRTIEMNAFRERLIAAASVNPLDLEKQLAVDPKNTTILGRLCALLRVEDPLKALDFCRRAYESDPKNTDHVIGFGAALVRARQYGSAISILSQVLEIAPDNFTARANLAVALFQLKRFAEAKREYYLLVERQPDLAVAYYFLGIIHDQLREYMDALANYQRFLKLADPERFGLEIEKVNLRLPGLQKQVKRK